MYLAHLEIRGLRISQKNVDSITEEIKRKTDRESRDRWGIKVESIRT